MGFPPSQVEVLVFSGKSRVREFRNDLLQSMTSMRKMFSKPMLSLLRPFLGKETVSLFRDYIVPVMNMYFEKDREGIDCFFYDAPVSLHFYSSMYADPADSVIAATYAMLAAESLGLGTCMLGFPGPALKFSKSLRKKYGLPDKIHQGMNLIVGYPSARHRYAIKRRFASVKRYGEGT